MTGPDDGDDGWDAGSAPNYGTNAGGLSTPEPARAETDHPFAGPERERYLDPKLLGWGGMGRVHAVRDARLNREVARKQAGESESSEGGERLSQEALEFAAGTGYHTNIGECKCNA